MSTNRRMLGITLATATTAGSFVAPPAYAEEMYNPALQGRTGGLRFEVRGRP